MLLTNMKIVTILRPSDLAKSEWKFNTDVYSKLKYTLYTKKNDYSLMKLRIY